MYLCTYVHTSTMIKEQFQFRFGFIHGVFVISTRKTPDVFYYLKQRFSHNHSIHVPLYQPMVLGSQHAISILTREIALLLDGFVEGWCSNLGSGNNPYTHKCHDHSKADRFFGSQMFGFRRVDRPVEIWTLFGFENLDKKSGRFLNFISVLQAETQHMEMQRMMKHSHSGTYTRQGLEDITKICKMHLLLGNIHRYCELLIELGEVGSLLLSYIQC